MACVAPTLSPESKQTELTKRMTTANLSVLSRTKDTPATNNSVKLAQNQIKRVTFSMPFDLAGSFASRYFATNRTTPASMPPDGRIAARTTSDNMAKARPISAWPMVFARSRLVKKAATAPVVRRPTNMAGTA